LKYDICHWSGLSTTPSKDMKKFEMILPNRYRSLYAASDRSPAW
jgi:hypothetical protein